MHATLIYMFLYTAVRSLERLMRSFGGNKTGREYKLNISRLILLVHGSKVTIRALQYACNGNLPILNNRMCRNFGSNVAITYILTYAVILVYVDYLLAFCSTVSNYFYMLHGITII